MPAAGIDTSAYPSRRTRDGGPDDTGQGELAPGAMAATLVRLGALFAAVALAYGPDLAALPATLGLDTPLAYAGLAPLLALGVAAVGLRVAPVGAPRLPLRSSDLIFGSSLVAVALLVAGKGPRLFGFDSGPWRVGLASLPFFLAGSVWLLFGGRVVWWLRHSLVLAALVAPVWYVWVVTATTVASTAATWAVVRSIAPVFGFHTTSVGGTNLVQVGDQFAAVSSVCSGASSMFGWALAALAMLPLLEGRFRRKAQWVLLGMLLAWVANTVRILVILVLGQLVSGDFALKQVHPFAGLVAVAVVAVIMLSLAGRFGLTTRRAVAPSGLRRLAATGPVRWRSAVTGVLVVALGIGLMGAAAWRLHPLGGRNGQINRPVAALLDDLSSIEAGDGRYRVVSFDDVPWAPQYFGTGADWQRSGLFRSDPAATTDDARAWLVSIDTTSVTDPARFDGYTLQACYGFHGYQVDRAEVSDLLTDRPAELLDYRDPGPGTGTFVLSWRQRVPDGRVERVTLSAVYAVGALTAENADLPDASTAGTMVRQLARVLSDEADRR